MAVRGVPPPPELACLPLDFSQMPIIVTEDDKEFTIKPNADMIDQTRGVDSTNNKTYPKFFEDNHPSNYVDKICTTDKREHLCIHRPDYAENKYDDDVATILQTKPSENHVPV